MNDSVGSVEHRSKQTPGASFSNTQVFILVVAIVIAVAGGTFGIRRYTISKDEAIGAALMQANQESAHRQNDPELERIIAEKKQRKLALEDSLKTNPSDTTNLLELGLLRVETGDTTGALALYEQYLAIKPDNIGALTDYGYLLYIAGKTEKGKALTEEIVKRVPSYQVALYNLAVIYYKEGDQAKALETMKKSYRADSTSQLAPQALSAIQHLEQEKSKSQ